MIFKVVKHEKEEFSKQVEEMVAECKCTYMDAIFEIANKKNIEHEIVPKLITARLKELLEEESMQLNLLKGDKSAKLPVD